MTTPRKPRPDLVDRTTVTAMIAEAVQAQRHLQEVSRPLGLRSYPTMRKK